MQASITVKLIGAISVALTVIALATNPARAQVTFQFKDSSSPEFKDLTPDSSKTSGKLPAAGDVLIAGGLGSNLKSTAATEFFDPQQKKFSATGPLGAARMFAASTIIGHTFFAAGGALETFKWNNPGKDLTITFAPLANAESFSETTGKFTSVANMLSVTRMGATATLFSAGPLAGKVLIVGGINNLGNVLASAEIYDPVSGTFTLTSGSLHTARYIHDATLLANNDVLITGGLPDNQGNVLDSAEIFDPNTGAFTVVGPMHDQRFEHTATLLPDNTVLVVGGYSSFQAGTLTSAEVYNPIAQTFTAVGSMTQMRGFHTATLLGNGKVLIAGGFSADEVTINPPSSDGLRLAGIYGFTAKSAELYDPATQTFSCIGGPGKQFANYVGFPTCASTMIVPHAAHTATLLPSGSPLAGDVLIAGGFSSVTPHKFPPPSKVAEIYDPVKNAFTSVGSMKTARAFAASGLLQ
jgi:Kelch motif